MRGKCRDVGSPGTWRKIHQIKRKNTPLFTTRQQWHVSRAPTWQRRRNNTGFTLPFEMQIWYAVWYGYSLEVSANLIWLHSMANVLSTTPKRPFAHVLQNSWPVCQRPPPVLIILVPCSLSLSVHVLPGIKLTLAHHVSFLSITFQFNWRVQDDDEWW